MSSQIAEALDITRGSDEAEMIADACSDYYFKPLEFVHWCWPWGEPGTPLEHEEGPDKWQTEFLERLGEEAELNFDHAVRMAVASGHGVGKTALVAWVIHWFISTRPNPQIVVTANTRNQLLTKTWRELAKWNELAINGHLYTWTATSYKFNLQPTTWYATATPWSEHNSDAFQGTHEAHVLIIFDEASAVADKIWEVTGGAMSTPGAMWLCFGNPTKNTGRFRECWRRFAHRWVTYQVDSRNAKMTNKQLIQDDIDDWGEDSDYVRVRWLGKFPEVGATQLISTSLVEGAQKRVIDDDMLSKRVPLIMGVDIARQGDDRTIIRLRRGPKLYADKWVYKVPNLMLIASYIAEKINDYDPDLVCIDMVGLGAGVFDRLKQLGFDNIVGVQAGERAKNDKIYANKRIEMWTRMKIWLEDADIPANDTELAEDLIAPEYYFNSREQMLLEPKQDIKDRIGRSPDEGDSLSLTLAVEHPIKRGEDTQYLEPEEV